VRGPDPKAIWDSPFILKSILQNFLIIKPTRCTDFSNLFWHEILHVSDISSVHYQELFTVLSVMVYVIQFYRQLSIDGYVVGCQLFFSVYFVIPYCRVGFVQFCTVLYSFVQFFFGVSILTCFLCLFGTEELYIQTCMTYEYTTAECTVNNSW
jgi:hypothetical protein